ncbi:FliI/YscN family ATPase [Cereibacter sphaeroides]|uniref:FliI/YscN family ATPase n=1 Tax=Cereibacter sphaeroides TaxID=1063 RepID=UPI001F1C4B64|nr:FliI/YscN family ATPase [Cereibacter sphaeroides]MCE6960923.1 FliI/YscN family ATPase [Cereibacter sphaeroides]MCE6969779.1 FliI/YscN family ATPase [Cereibacter sphaeroides]MCE6975254.1 FliI/YscN family ATPase [Cereibacter sphaeroides]
MSCEFDGLLSEIAGVPLSRRFGRVTEIARGTIGVSGLTAGTGLGDRVMIQGANGPVGGEVLRLSREETIVLPDGSVDGLTIGDPVELVGPAEIAPSDSWIGRIVDPLGRPLDGRPLFRGPVARSLRSPAPAAASRRGLGPRLQTGTAVFDTLLPLVQGQRIGLFAGSGVGKSSLLAKFARGVSADVVVIGLVGERGRELRDFTDRVLGPEGMARSVIVTATSDQSPLIRRRCGWAAMAVAEHFRDQGLHVLLLADSITRFAEAHREVALAGGEEASMRGFPPSTAHTIMSLAERAGPGPEGSGDITAVFSVLVAGSDMEEPVADILRGVLDGHVVMDRKIAERGRFPAIDLLRSVSRSLPEAASAAENALIGEARRLLGAWDRAEMMIQAGLYAKGSDPQVDAAIRVWPALDAFLAEDSPEGVEASFRRLAACLAI